jgi:Tfp pilus assembly protein FimT
MACYKLKGKGLTLMELLVTLSLVMLLVTLSAPCHSELMQKQHAKGDRNATA